MDKWILEQMQKITPEEQDYLDGDEQVNREIYTKKETFEIDSQLFLKQGKLITVRHHSRFIEFPEHKHNYIEIVYVCAGEITHYIDGKELVTQPGDLLLMKIAEDFNQSLPAISRLIKKNTGYTFIELLMRKRFQKAVMFLIETELPVEEIAANVGYENLSYFYRQFKARYGMTPNQYRLEHKNDKHVKI